MPHNHMASVSEPWMLFVLREPVNAVDLRMLFVLREPVNAVDVVLLTFGCCLCCVSLLMLLTLCCLAVDVVLFGC